MKITDTSDLWWKTAVIYCLDVETYLDSDGDGARLVSADGRRLEAASADQLLPQVLGIEVPVARLALWVQAAPDDRAEVRLRDTLGRPLLLVDHGWRIDYQVVSDGLVDRAVKDWVDRAEAYDMRWSDHAPVTVVYE